MSKKPVNKAPDRNIVRKKLDELIPYARNPRTHSNDQIAVIAGSIREFGWTNPVLLDGQNGIIAGHGRVLAARKLGLREVPCIELADLTEAQRRAYVIADNQTALRAGWDDELLRLEIGDLSGLGFDLDLLGFDSDALAALLAPAGSQGLTDPDEVPEPPKNPVSRTGDLWALGRHRLLCGDNGEATGWDRLMDGVFARLVVTSPPYNQKINTFKPSGMQKESPSFVNRMAGAYQDDLPEDEYRADQLDRFSLIASYVTEDSSIFYNHKVRYRNKKILHPYEIVVQFPFNIRQEIIWNRSSSITLNARMFVPCDERIYWMTKSATFVFNDNVDIKKQSSVWTFAARNEISASAAYPVELPKRCIEAASVAGDIVADPYSGTGTTLVAAEMTGRTCRAVELSPIYVDVAIERWQNFTGQRATLDGKPWDEVQTERYDPNADVAGSFEAAYEAVRESVTNGGPGWSGYGPPRNDAVPANG